MSLGRRSLLAAGATALAATVVPTAAQAALRPIVEPVLSQPGDAVANGVRANVLAQVVALTETSPIIREKVESGKLGVAGARYDLDTGKVTLL